MADETVVSIIPWPKTKDATATTNKQTTNETGKNTSKSTSKTAKTTVKQTAKRKGLSKLRPRGKAAGKTRADEAAAGDDDLPLAESLLLPDFMELVNEPPKTQLKSSANNPAVTDGLGPEPAPTAPSLPAPQLPAPMAAPVTPVTPRDESAETGPPAAQPRDDRAFAPPHASSFLLRAAALALAAVGMAMNGWFGHSLGSSDVAGWMFLAIGVTADLVALVMPTCAARLWHARHRATALAGWAVWTMTFIFAVTASIGFASTNISDVALKRGSRVTPAVQSAQTALTDAMAARDRECKGGVGKFCREREAAVAERRQALDTAQHAVGQTADPQSEAAIKLVAWVSRGAVKPTTDDFAMLRLVLLALLPQVGGILLMVGRKV